MLEPLIEQYQKAINQFSSQKFWTDTEYERAESRRDTLQDIVNDLKKIKTATNPP